MTSFCLELPYGAIRHFPAGTYREQMATMTGRIELELMDLVHSVWYAFSHLGPSKWKQPQLKLVEWLEKKPPPPPPSKRFDRLMLVRLGYSPYVTLILERIRNAKPH